MSTDLSSLPVPLRSEPPAGNVLSLAMTLVAGIALGGALWGLMAGQESVALSAYVLTVQTFLAGQDAPVLWLFVLFFVAVGIMAKADRAIPAFAAIGRTQALRIGLLACVVVCATVWLGASLVCQKFPLSVDEFMAEFDARIFASGRLLAPVAPEWRDYVPALQPIFRLALPDNLYWASAYLPMNAAIRAVFVLIGAPALEGVALAGVAILALFAVARRLWPDRPDAAVVAAVLLGCSSQFLITAMTPYAMTAHLALNMVWLWLFLRDTRPSHAMAAGLAFVACGLHQVVFHPLFAAPFVASLATARRWKLMAYYGAVYAAAVLFWILYWSLLLRAVGAPITPTTDVGMLNFVHRVAVLVKFSIGDVFVMALNLLRFLAWQSPLMIPLALAGLLTRGPQRATMMCIAGGIALTLGAALVLLPFQGHGWGYRYLHGFLGGLALMAAQGWIRMTDRAPQAFRATAPALAASVLVSVLVLLPWRAYQVRGFIAPYAAAADAIEGSVADAVIVDSTDIWYGQDLARNDPFLRTRPKVLLLTMLDEARLGALCRRYDVAVFDRNDARRIGLGAVETQPGRAGRDRKLRDFLRAQGCGRPIEAAR